MARWPALAACRSSHRKLQCQAKRLGAANLVASTEGSIPSRSLSRNGHCGDARAVRREAPSFRGGPGRRRPRSATGNPVASPLVCWPANCGLVEYWRNPLAATRVPCSELRARLRECRSRTTRSSELPRSRHADLRERTVATWLPPYFATASASCRMARSICSCEALGTSS